MRKIRDFKKKRGDFTYLAIPLDFYSLLYHISQLLQRENIITKIKNVVRILYESFKLLILE